MTEELVSEEVGFPGPDERDQVPSRWRGLEGPNSAESTQACSARGSQVSARRFHLRRPSQVIYLKMWQNEKVIFIKN